MSRVTDLGLLETLPARGNIELQYHGHKLYWENMYEA
jgi:hypothetical protein